MEGNEQSSDPTEDEEDASVRSSTAEEEGPDVSSPGPRCQLIWLCVCVFNYERVRNLLHIQEETSQQHLLTDVRGPLTACKY